MSTSDLRSTPLEQVHERLGATFTDFAGWRMPVRYGSDLAEHHAVRTAAGVTQLTRTPVVASSLPSDLVSAMTAALEAE